MADPAAVSVVGLARLRKDMRQVGADMADLKDANQRAGQVVLAAVDAPARTGRLAASGRASRAVGRASILYGGAAVPYAGPIHWGWPARGIEPDLFVVDAARQTEPVWVALYQADLDQLAGSLDGNTY